jgi:hypothetical protein
VAVKTTEGSVSWSEIWHALTTSRYTCALEEEVARLRAENRALVNSLLGTAGVPPLRIEGAANGTEAREAPKPGAPIRRRSWQQIGRMLEIEEARHAAAGNGPHAPATSTRPADD